MKGFRQFLMRGNLIELAIAVVIGTAFSAIVTAIVKDLITPLIAAIGGKPEFGRLQFTVNHSTFAYGDFINALVTFLIIGSDLHDSGWKAWAGVGIAALGLPVYFLWKGRRPSRA